MTIDWRKATPDEILAHVEELDAVEDFEAALESGAFNEDHVRLLLKNPGLSSELVERISREPRFFKRNALRAAMVLHPKLPRVRALELVPYLYWRDSLRVASSLRVHPQVRVVAEQHVAERVPDLTPGERISIARTATKSVLRALREDTDPRVVTALLHNYRCTEEDALFLSANASTPPQVLAVVARHPKWKRRPAVRAQLVRNRRLGLPLALGLLDGLGKAQLEGVARKHDLPKVLRESARRLAREMERGGVASRR